MLPLIFINLALTLEVMGLLSRTFASIYSPRAFTRDVPNVISPHVFPLKRTSASSCTAEIIHSSQYGHGIAAISPVRINQGLSVAVQRGNQSLSLLLDTGSSDTWFVAEGFRCTNRTRSAQIPEIDCEFGPVARPSLSFTRIPDQTFNVSYGSGAYLSGYFGFEDLIIGEINVPHQQIAMVDYAAWSGDGNVSGILGMAYPSLTHAYGSVDSARDNFKNHFTYSPVFSSMYMSGIIEPVFSLAIQKGDHPGYLALGGLPPVPFVPPLISTSIQILSIGPGTENYSFYAIKIEGVWVDNSKSNKEVKPRPLQAILDSGTALMYLPTTIANTINEQFSPPATRIDNGEYKVACNAIPPKISIQISGALFVIDQKEMLIDYGDDLCYTGVADAGERLPTLGLVFLRNRLTVYDVGAAKIRLADLG